MLQILQGDVLTRLRELPAESVQCCVTSPPYWGLRDYGTGAWEGGDVGCDHKQGRSGASNARGYEVKPSPRNRDGAGAFSGDCKCGARRIDSQLGLEKTPEEYVAKMVEVFREVRRVLRKDGTLWLNLGDSYCASPPGLCSDPMATSGLAGVKTQELGREACRTRLARNFGGLKPKDLCGIPWRVALALQADGWWLRHLRLRGQKRNVCSGGDEALHRPRSFRWEWHSWQGGAGAWPESHPD